MNKYLAAALPVTVLLVVLAFFLPAQLSQWNDQKLLDDPVVLPSTAGDLAGFAEGVSLTVPEKLLLLRSGRLSAMEIPQELEQPLIIQEASSAPAEKAPAEDGEADLAEREEKSARKWQERVESALGELQQLQRMGGLPTLWGADSAVEVTARVQTLYMEPETQRGVLVDDMTLSCTPYTLALELDDETGKVLSFTLWWTRGNAPSWGVSGPVSFGSAWRDYWGMDNVDGSWSGKSVTSMLSETEILFQTNGDYTSSAEVSFAYDTESLRVPLHCWAISGRGCSIQWNH